MVRMMEGFVVLVWSEILSIDEGSDGSGIKVLWCLINVNSSM